MLEAHDITVGYLRGVPVLNGVSIAAEESKITALIGHNGAGKSTLLKALCGFLKPWSGHTYLDKEEITEKRPNELVSKGIVYIMQRRHTFPELTVQNNLRVASWLHRKDHKYVSKAIEDAYERFPLLRKKRSQKAVSMSGGEQRMLELAMALITDARIMLVDEPSAGLAPMVVKEVYDHLKSLRKEGRTILLVDQNVKAAVEVCDYLYVMELGKNKVQGPRDQFDALLGELVKSWVG